jgi:hypothetical protein
MKDTWELYNDIRSVCQNSSNVEKNLRNTFKGLMVIVNIGTT